MMNKEEKKIRIDNKKDDNIEIGSQNKNILEKS